MFKALLMSIFTICVAGCATITEDSEQSITILTVCAGSSKTVKAECIVSNDNNRKLITTPGTVVIARSNENLDINCKRKGELGGKASIKSLSNIHLFENIVFGGVIGVAIDAGTGAGFDYPKLVTLLMQCSLNKYS